MNIKHQWKLEIAALFIIAILFCHRILVFDDRVFPAAAQFVESLVQQAYYRDAILRYHQIPFWDNTISPGVPYITLNTLHNFFSTPIVLFFGEVLGVKILILLAVFFSGLGMWYFSKRILKVSASSRLLAASTYMLSGFFVVNISQGKIHRMLGATVIPYAFAFLYLSVYEKDIKYKIFTAVFMALFIFSGENYFFQYFFFVFLFFVFFNSFNLQGKGLSGFRVNMQNVKTFVLITAFFLMFSAVHFLPILELQKQMYRVVSQFEDFSDPFLGSLMFDDYVKRFFSMEVDRAFWDKYAFVGFVIPVFAILSLLHNSKKKTFLYLMLFFFILYGMGKYSLFKFIIPYVPLMKSLRWPSRTLQYASFFLIALSSLGFEWFVNYSKRNRNFSVRVFFFFLLFLTASSSYVHMMFFKYGYINSSNFFPTKYVIPSILAFLLMFILGLILGHDLTLHQKCFFYGILAVNVSSLLLVNGVFMESYPNPVVSESSKVFSWLREYDPTVYSIRVDIPGNDWGMYNYPAYKAGFIFDVDEAGGWWLKVAKDRNRSFNRYLISGYDLNETNLKFVKRFDNLSHISYTQRSGLTNFKEVRQDFYIYRLLDALPYSFVLDASSNTLPAEIVEFTPNKIVVQANKERDFEALVVLTNFYPGWKVSVDGGKFYDAGNFHGFISTPLREGSHVYLFKFNPLSFKIGFFLTFISIFIMAFLLLKK